MESIVKGIDEIRRSEWITYEWINVTAWGDKTRQYLRGHIRRIEDAPYAADQFDIWVENYRAEMKRGGE
jgi:hypothetical protein